MPRASSFVMFSQITLIVGLCAPESRFYIISVAAPIFQGSLVIFLILGI